MKKPMNSFQKRFHLQGNAKLEVEVVDHKKEGPIEEVEYWDDEICYHDKKIDIVFEDICGKIYKEGWICSRCGFKYGG
jgi:hypothetical protein